MKFTAKQIADFLKGEVEGDPDAAVGDISKIESGRKPVPWHSCPIQNMRKYFIPQKLRLCLLTAGSSLPGRFPAPL
jgi:hypothetical protein